MTGLGRALYGAAIGSLLTLIAHPASRPVILSLWLQPATVIGPATRAYAQSELPSLPTPHSLDDASLWVQSGADRGRNGIRTTPAEINSLLKVVRAASEVDQENAYWLQMAAVYLHELGRSDEARKSWMLAARCRTWNDYQSTRLVELRRGLEKSCGTKMSWQSVMTFYQRSVDPANAIDTFARWLLQGKGLSKSGDLQVRLATIENASLMVDGSRSIAVGMRGSLIFDQGCGVGGANSVTRAARYRARYAFKAAIQKNLGTIEAERAEVLLRHIEAWNALTSTDPAVENPREVLLGSALTGSVPGMFFGLGLLGLALYLVGWLAGYWPRSPIVRLAVLLSAALLLGGLAYLKMGLPIIGLLVVISISFQAFTPVEGDRRQLKRLGSLFEIAVTVFAIVLTSVVGLLLVGEIAAGASTLLYLGVPNEYLFGSTTLEGIAVIILCLLLVIPPAWAVSHRVSTAQVIRLMFKRLGTILAAGSLCLAIVLTPISLMLDRGLSEKMDKLLENEPLYYVQP